MGRIFTFAKPGPRLDKINVRIVIDGNLREDLKSLTSSGGDISKLTDDGRALIQMQVGETIKDIYDMSLDGSTLEAEKSFENIPINKAEYVYISINSPFIGFRVIGSSDIYKSKWVCIDESTSSRGSISLMLCRNYYRTKTTSEKINWDIIQNDQNLAYSFIACSNPGEIGSLLQPNFIINSDRIIDFIKQDRNIDTNTIGILYVWISKIPITSQLKDIYLYILQDEGISDNPTYYSEAWAHIDPTKEINDTDSNACVHDLEFFKSIYLNLGACSPDDPLAISSHSNPDNTDISYYHIEMRDNENGTINTPLYVDTNNGVAINGTQYFDLNPEYGKVDIPSIMTHVGYIHAEEREDVESWQSNFKPGKLTDNSFDTTNGPIQQDVFLRKETDNFTSPITGSKTSNVNIVLDCTNIDGDPVVDVLITEKMDRHPYKFHIYRMAPTSDYRYITINMVVCDTQLNRDAENNLIPHYVGIQLLGKNRNQYQITCGDLMVNTVDIIANSNPAFKILPKTK